MAANNKTNPEAASSLKKYRNGFVMCWIICIIYLYRDHLSIAKKVYLTYKTDDRGVAQPGSASGLGLEAKPPLIKSKNIAFSTLIEHK